MVTLLFLISLDCIFVSYYLFTYSCSSGEPVIHCMGPAGEIKAQYAKVTGNRHKISFSPQVEGEDE